jgi:DNA-binding MarR family transcriptional regulator
LTEALDPRVFASTCLCLAVRRAARTLSRRYDEVLADLGVNHGQFTILMALSSDRPVSIGELSADLDVDRTSLTMALKPLARDGLLRLRPDPTDGRARVVTLTDKGRSVLDAAIPRWRGAQADTLKATRLEDDRALRAALAALA